ncbi:hypothetical protein H2200_012869 [Cladophialophora chaetospira]|uniref:Heterokaryon incompatibility domain-containing protein n=1 Tax=Cladophialophora chaetospira TaxID=386627 RepID=A0AA39CC01_9EURO|nr:hypothetical protein H2200_012869 [Cladophialophora chaetospira]
MAPDMMCKTCMAIPFLELPSIEEPALPHLPSLDTLDESALSCMLCALLYWALGCSFRTGGWTKFGRITLPGGKVFHAKWSGSNNIAKVGMKAKHGMTTIDPSPAEPLIEDPVFVEPRAFLKDGDGSVVRPWLFGNWYASPMEDRQPLLVGLGVRLAATPYLEDAVGIVEKDSEPPWIRLPGTFIRVREDRDFEPQSPIPGRLRCDLQDSRLAITRIKGWIKGCDDHHPCAYEHSCISSPHSPLLPTRILDVGLSSSSTVRLIEPRGVRDHYIALSHCWGTSDRLTTLSNNIDAHKEGINISGLALTFRDAIFVSRELGVQYVWIDSLCIIQDDYQDWLREAPKMGEVYSAAYLTIAAASASDDSEGLFTTGDRRRSKPMISCDSIGTGRECLTWAAPTVLTSPRGSRVVTGYRQKRIFAHCDVEEDLGDEAERDPRRVYCTPEWMPASLKPKKATEQISGDERDVYVPTKDTQMYLVGRFGGKVDPFVNEPLNTRGWTVQERILSKRTLHFGSEELLWECQDFVVAEDGSMLEREYPNLNRLLESRRSNRWLQWYLKGTENDHVRAARQSWFRLVEDYCARALTKPADKLPALSGLAHAIAERSNDTYCAGTWMNDLLHGLNWEVEVVELRHQCDNPEHDRMLPPPKKSIPIYPERYRAPSWSWAAFDARVKFKPLQYGKEGGPEWIILANACDVVVHPRGEDKFGALEGGYLILKAPLHIVRPWPETVDGQSSNAKKRSIFTLDVQVESTTQGVRRGVANFDDRVVLPCFAVALSVSSALLLKPREDGPIFEGTVDSGGSGSTLWVPSFTRIGLVSFWGWAGGEWKWSLDPLPPSHRKISPPAKEKAHTSRRRRSSFYDDPIETDLADVYDDFRFLSGQRDSQELKLDGEHEEEWEEVSARYPRNELFDSYYERRATDAREDDTGILDDSSDSYHETRRVDTRGGDTQFPDDSSDRHHKTRTPNEREEDAEVLEFAGLRLRSDRNTDESTTDLLASKGREHNRRSSTASYESMCDRDDRWESRGRREESTGSLGYRVTRGYREESRGSLGYRERTKRCREGSKESRDKSRDSREHIGGYRERSRDHRGSGRDYHEESRDNSERRSSRDRSGDYYEDSRGYRAYNQYTMWDRLDAAYSQEEREFVSQLVGDANGSREKAEEALQRLADGSERVIVIY